MSLLDRVMGESLHKLLDSPAHKYEPGDIARGANTAEMNFRRAMANQTTGEHHRKRVMGMIAKLRSEKDPAKAKERAHALDKHLGRFTRTKTTARRIKAEPTTTITVTHGRSGKPFKSPKRRRIPLKSVAPEATSKELRQMVAHVEPRLPVVMETFFLG